MMRG